LEMLVGAITAQQVNLAFAFACRARLVRRYGNAVRLAGETVWAFPDAAALARSSVRGLRALKFSGRKAEYIRDLARAVVGSGRDLSERAIRRRASAWGRYQNLAVHYLLAGMRRLRQRTGGGA